MYPGEFIWRRISDGWLVTKAASMSFSISAAVIILMSVVIFSGAGSRSFGPIANVLLGIGGVLGSFSAFFLWGGMWRYWITRHNPMLPGRRVWFVILCVGVWYGAILYYWFAYLPGIRTLDTEGSRGPR